MSTTMYHNDNVGYGQCENTSEVRRW